MSIAAEIKIGAMSPKGSAAHFPESKYDRLIARAKGVAPARTIVVYPCDETSLRAATEAAEIGIITPILVGPAAIVNAVAREHKLHIGNFKLIDAPDSETAAAKAVAMIRAAEGDLLMKGSLHTDELMRAVTASSTGLRTPRRISHVFIMDVPSYPETLFITDAAINIAPDLDAKHDIIQNAIDLYTQLGLGTPRVAILSAVETVTAKIPSTLDAAALCKMADRKQITGGIVDGPARVRQRDRSGGGEDQGHRIPGRGKGANPSRARSRGRQYARQKPHLHAEGRLGRPRTWSTRTDHSHLTCGFRTQPHGILRRGCALRCRPPRQRQDVCGVSRDGSDSRRQRRVLERQVSDI